MKHAPQNTTRIVQVGHRTRDIRSQGVPKNIMTQKRMKQRGEGLGGREGGREEKGVVLKSDERKP